MHRVLTCGLLALIAAGVAGAQQMQALYATLQVPGEATGYVSASLKTGPESNAAFFVLNDDILRLGNVNYKLVKDQAQASSANGLSLQDPNGRFLIFDHGSLSKSASPENGSQWFRLRFYSAAQREEIENRRRAYQTMTDGGR